MISTTVLLLAGVVGLSLANPLLPNTEDCRGETVSCLAATAVQALDRAARSPDLGILPGLVSLTGEPGGSRAARELQTLEEVQAASPAAALEAVYQAAVGFLKGRSLRIQLPDEAPETLDRAIEEGRAKLKKKFLPILLLVGAKLAALLPLAIGAIGLMAIKALVVGKLALVIAAVIAFQKFFSGGGASAALPSFGKSPSYDVGSTAGWSTSGSSSGGGPYYRRSMESAAAHDLAYASHIPSVDSNSAQ